MAERLLGASLRFSRSCYRILFETIGGPWPSRGRHEHIRWPRGKPWPSYTLKLYFFINSRAATVMAFTPVRIRSEEHTSELQSHSDLVCRLLLEKKKSALTDLSKTHAQTDELVSHARYDDHAEQLYWMVHDKWLSQPFASY